MTASAHNMTEAKAPATKIQPRRQQRYAAEDVEICAAAAEPKSVEVIWLTRRLHVQWAIETEHRRYLLRGLFMLRLFEEDDLTVARSDLLSLEGFGTSAKESIDDFCENFDAQYRALVEEDEDALTPGAVAIRKALLEVVDQCNELS